MSFHPARILPRRWTAIGAIESFPAHLSVLQCLQTKSLVRGLPFLGVPLLTPQLIVTSNMLLWCFRHIFLMFYTPYNLGSVEKHILPTDIIDGVRDPARVKLAERFLSPRRRRENTRTHTHTLTVILSKLLRIFEYKSWRKVASSEHTIRFICTTLQWSCLNIETWISIFNF